MRPPILYAAAAELGQAFAERWRGAQPVFCCVLAHTDTCLIPGLSAAGVSEELRPLTPAADAEVVLDGQAYCLPTLPSNPLGAPGPAGITRAAVQLGGFDARFVGIGLRVWPRVACQRIDGPGGASIEQGSGVANADALLEAGYQLGAELAGSSQCVVLGESVPGGTTTALAVLLALGYAADGRVSGSHADNAHSLKSRVAHSGLAANGFKPGDCRADPIRAISAVGDPMQPVVAGATLGAVAAGASVLLAGGSQMLAVAALAQAIGGSLDNVAIGTTRWVVQDSAAEVAGLCADVSTRLPLLGVNLDFSESRHPPLRLYERFLVKEGVGAGGACIAALLGRGKSIERLQMLIDDVYDEVLSGVRR
jgi:uncharacterized protein (TIGR00303 family)